MVTAIILLKLDRERINETAEKLADDPAVSEVYSVSGSFDLVVVVRVKNNDGLADLVTQRMAALPGIRQTETMLAFRAYSRHDIEGMFSIGS